MSKYLRFCFASLLVLAVCALSAMAQSTTTGAINGSVTNPNKEVVVGASIVDSDAQILIALPTRSVGVTVDPPMPLVALEPV